jgi:23S rRNA (adenine2030-N6)-methyltransferase
MNYQHAFHAGNFADVVKHAVLARILMHLRQKPAAFRVIDTHAGSGVYDLHGAEAGRTGEWRDGIARLIGPGAASLSERARTLLQPYLDAVASYNRPGQLAVYPGSPAIVATMLRPQDQLIACELEPRAASALTRELRAVSGAKALTIDGWTALSAYVPPKERRGLVLIDPPYEQPDELSRLVRAFETAHRKWATGSYLMWYPIKDAAVVSSFVRKLSRLGVGKMLRMELIVATGSEDLGLRGTGLVAVNPPWTLHDDMTVLLPALAAALRRSTKVETTLDWIGSEISR